MNFDFLKPLQDMKKLYDYCSEAEEFVISKPNISVGDARKAVEYIVKTIYISLVGDDHGYTTFEMMTDSRFIDYIDDRTFMNSVHYVRKMGNIAIHESDITQSFDPIIERLES